MTALMRRRRFWIWAAIGFQVLVLALMAGKREWIAVSGRPVWLRTAPVDPRDPFRGDFVRLRYDISVIPFSMASEDLKTGNRKKGTVIYTILEVGEDGLAVPVSAQKNRPSGGLFIKGRISRDWGVRTGGNGFSAAYGIEAYFVEQGKGKEMERRLGRRSDIQTPLEMKVALGKDGTAVITGHRWSTLGMGLDIVRSPRPTRLDGEGPPSPQSAMLRLRFLNTSQNPVGLVLPEDLGTLHLQPVLWARKTWTEAAAPASRNQPVSPSDIRMLAPHEEIAFEIDLASPRWYVRTPGGEVRETGNLDGNEMFRLVYEPPPEPLLKGLPGNTAIRPGRMASRAFHGQGRVD